jgi:hypothetical protein
MLALGSYRTFRVPVVSHAHDHQEVKKKGTNKVIRSCYNMLITTVSMPKETVTKNHDWN